MADESGFMPYPGPTAGCPCCKADTNPLGEGSLQISPNESSRATDNGLYFVMGMAYASARGARELSALCEFHRLIFETSKQHWRLMAREGR